MVSQRVRAEIKGRLKTGPEQEKVVGPTVERLVNQGWSLDQIVFGKKEWKVPKTPSERTKRDKGKGFDYFPVDIAVFDTVETTTDPHHLRFIIECKQPNETAGAGQLEIYLSNEPSPRLGVWANDPTNGAPAVFLYRNPDGSILTKKRSVSDLPAPDEPIEPTAQRLTYKDLVTPPENLLKNILSDLLDHIVVNDSQVSRDEQLDQLCNLLLLKLESDKRARSDPKSSVFFRPLASPKRTADALKHYYKLFAKLHIADTFTTPQDQELRFSDSTIAQCVEVLSGLRLIDIAVSSIATAFQVLRSEALKQTDGQYFTPRPVIEAGIRLMDLTWEDIIIDPACGTGGFLVESLLEIKRRNKDISDRDLAAWAQKHVYGIEKDPIGLKLTKAIMQIAGDGSAHCAKGDSIRTFRWSREYPHLQSEFKDNRFSVVITNPPFGKGLKVKADDARMGRYSIAMNGDGTYKEREIGLIFLERAYRLVHVGGRIGIVLPETYFFSSGYSFLFDWLKPRLRPLVVANIPMEAFQGFARAKTSFYVFEKIADVDED